MENQLVTTKSSQNILLFCVLLAVFVVPTSISGTAIVLASINSELHSNAVTLQWVVNSFNLTFACFTLAWGGLADVFGSKKSFLLGSTLYFMASIFSWMAQDIYMLDISRAIAGIGGAAIFSCGSAILIKEFSGEQRTKAFALFGTTAGVNIVKWWPLFNVAVVYYLSF
jgi:MFS family permease